MLDEFELGCRLSNRCREARRRIVTIFCLRVLVVRTQEVLMVLSGCKTSLLLGLPYEYTTVPRMNE